MLNIVTAKYQHCHYKYVSSVLLPIYHAFMQAQSPWRLTVILLSKAHNIFDMFTNFKNRSKIAGQKRKNLRYDIINNKHQLLKPQKLA